LVKEGLLTVLVGLLTASAVGVVTVSDLSRDTLFRLVRCAACEDATQQVLAAE
jgi:hypothetical protein